jgi:hypothetical protein
MPLHINQQILLLLFCDLFDFKQSVTNHTQQVKAVGRKYKFKLMCIFLVIQARNQKKFCRTKNGYSSRLGVCNFCEAIALAHCNEHKHNAYRNRGIPHSPKTVMGATERCTAVQWNEFADAAKILS